MPEPDQCVIGGNWPSGFCDSASNNVVEPVDLPEPNLAPVTLAVLPSPSTVAVPESCPMCEEVSLSSLQCEKVDTYNDCMFSYCDWSSQFLKD